MQACANNVGFCWDGHICVLIPLYLASQANSFNWWQGVKIISSMMYYIYIYINFELIAEIILMLTVQPTQNWIPGQKLNETTLSDSYKYSWDERHD